MVERNLCFGNGQKEDLSLVLVKQANQVEVGSSEVPCRMLLCAVGIRKSLVITRANYREVDPLYVYAANTADITLIFQCFLYTF